MLLPITPIPIPNAKKTIVITWSISLNCNNWICIVWRTLELPIFSITTSQNPLSVQNLNTIDNVNDIEFSAILRVGGQITFTNCYFIEQTQNLTELITGANPTFTNCYTLLVDPDYPDIPTTSNHPQHNYLNTGKSRCNSCNI